MDQLNLDKTSWTVEEIQKYVTEGYRERRENEFPPVAKEVRPIDYVHEMARGTIEYNEKWKNYSFHNVIIPDKTVLRDCNFSQAIPKTDCIIGNNLEFIDCNMTNVLIDPTWKTTFCNNSQVWFKNDEDTTFVTQLIATSSDTEVIFVKPNDAVTEVLPEAFDKNNIDLPKDLPKELQDAIAAVGVLI